MIHKVVTAPLAHSMHKKGCNQKETSHKPCNIDYRKIQLALFFRSPPFRTIVNHKMFGKYEQILYNLQNQTI